MTETYFPFDAGAGSSVYEADWGTMMRHVLSTGVIRSRQSAFDLNLLEVYGDTSGMQVKIKTGSAFVDGFFYSSDAEQTKTITAADATNDRIDRVVLKLDRAANTISIVVKAGTPAATPSPPTLTQTTTGVYELQLAQVLVGANVSTINAGDVTDERIFNYGGYDQRTIMLPLLDDVTGLIVDDPIEDYTFPVPPWLDRYNLVQVAASTQGLAGTTASTIIVKKNGVTVLTTNITIAANQKHSWAAGTQPVVDSTKQELRTGDLLRFQCSVAGSGAKGFTGYLVVARHG